MQCLPPFACAAWGAAGHAPHATSRIAPRPLPPLHTCVPPPGCASRPAPASAWRRCVRALTRLLLLPCCAQVREDALHMLHVLSQREWGVAGAGGGGRAGPSRQGTQDMGGADGGGDDDAGECASVLSDLGGGGGDAVVVLGNLQDSYQQFQYQLSCKLARCVRVRAGACVRNALLLWVARGGHTDGEEMMLAHTSMGHNWPLPPCLCAHTQGPRGAE